MSAATATNLFDNGIIWFFSNLLVPSRHAIFRVIWNHYRCFPLFLIFSLIRFVWNLALRVQYWVLRDFKPLASIPYERSAHVERVIWTCKATPVDEARPAYYLTCHDRFERPECIFSENVMLARVFRDRALFVDFGKPVQVN